MARAMRSCSLILPIAVAAQLCSLRFRLLNSSSRRRKGSEVSDVQTQPATTASWKPGVLGQKDSKWNLLAWWMDRCVCNGSGLWSETCVVYTVYLKIEVCLLGRKEH